MSKMTNDTLLRAAKRGRDWPRSSMVYAPSRAIPTGISCIKGKYSLFEITHQPELCAYVTRLPVEQYDVDAAILYKDIMSPLPAIGVDVEIQSGIGPVINNPIQSLADVEKNLGKSLLKKMFHMFWIQ